MEKKIDDTKFLKLVILWFKDHNILSVEDAKFILTNCEVN